MPYLECTTIEKSYGAVTALVDASFSIEKGEIRALFGGNGSGKSTLAKILGGSVVPDNGRIMWKDTRYSPRSPSDAKKQGVVITSQELSLSENLTVEENIVLANIPRSMGLFADRVAIRSRATDVLELIGLSGLEERIVYELPDNQKFMVELAKALVQEPELLVVDEITSALYRDEVEVFSGIVKDLASRGTSILFISHRMNEVFALCSSVTVMRNGAVVGTYDLSEVDENTLLGLLTGGRKSRHAEVSIEVPAEESKNGESENLLDVRGLIVPGFDRPVSLTARRGEVIGIAGLQGQGQSEFVRALFGLLGPVPALVGGETKTIYSPRSAVRLGFAFLSGEREKEGTFAPRSISENLQAVIREALGQRSVAESDVLDQFGVVYHRTSQPLRTLSGGNQQKVVLARWTAALPRIILADDPTKGVDVAARTDVHQAFKQLADLGSAVIMVSSDDRELVELARVCESSRILVMYQGYFVKELRGDHMSVHEIISASLPRKGSGTIK